MSFPSLTELVGIFDYKESLITTTTGGVDLFQADARRAAFICSNTVQGSVAWISMRQSTQNLRGIVVPAIGSAFECTVQKFGPMARFRWTASHTGITAGVLFVTEIYYTPEQYKEALQSLLGLYAGEES